MSYVLIIVLLVNVNSSPRPTTITAEFANIGACSTAQANIEHQVSGGTRVIASGCYPTGKQP